MNCTRCHSPMPEFSRFCPFCGKAVLYTPTKKKRGNGQGTAIKRNKTWTGRKAGYMFVDEDGKLHRIRPSKGGFPTKREALEWACSDADKEKPLPKLADLWQGYSESDMKKLSASKQTAYKIARKRLESIIARRIDTLTVDDLQSVINRCETYYPAKDVKNLLSKLYQRAMASNSNNGRVTQNLSEFLVLPDLEETESVPFTDAELKSLWNLYNSGHKFTGYILLMCYTGMMTGELLKCKSSMIDLENCEIHGAGMKTKARKTADIVFPAFMRPVVEELATGDKLIAINKDNFYERFYETLDLAGIDNPTDEKGTHRLTPYSCRHTYGTEAVKLGVHPAVIQRMLRHSNQKTQERYTHLDSTEVHEAAEQMDGSQMVHKKPSDD